MTRGAWLFLPLALLCMLGYIAGDRGGRALEAKLFPFEEPPWQGFPRQVTPEGVLRIEPDPANVSGFGHASVSWTLARDHGHNCYWRDGMVIGGPDSPCARQARIYTRDSSAPLTTGQHVIRLRTR